MFIDTEEGKAIADALVILNGYCLHRMSVEGTGRHKWAPADPIYPYMEKRTPEEFVRRSATHLIERFRIAMDISAGSMYVQDIGAHKKARGAL